MQISFNGIICDERLSGVIDYECTKQTQGGGGILENDNCLNEVIRGTGNKNEECLSIYSGNRPIRSEVTAIEADIKMY